MDRDGLVTRLLDCLPQSLAGPRGVCGDTDKNAVSADGMGRDSGTLQQPVGVALSELAIAETAWLRL